MKHIISECRDQFPYEFVESGHAAMNNHIKYKNVLMANNDFQNSVQGISIIGLPRSAMYLSYTRNTSTKELQDWFLAHSGVEYVEPTAETDSEGRWIIIVLRDEFENAKHWIEDILNLVPSLMTDDECTHFKSHYQIFPPCLYTKAPLGGKIQQGSEESYDRIMNNLSRYSNNSSSKPAGKKSGTTWSKPKRYFFDANPASFPALPSKDNSSRTTAKEHVESGSATSTTRTSPTKAAQTLASNDIDTIVSRFETVVSQYNDTLERLMKDNN
jgi:hypothetical protein